MNNRTIFVIAVIFLIAVATNWLLETSERETQTSPPKDEPDVYMVNATVKQFDSKGKIQHIVSASRFTHYSQSQITTLSLPVIELFMDSASDPWTILSSEGSILPEKGEAFETLELWGKVSASRTYADGDLVNIESENLTVIPDKEFIESKSDISITNAISVTEAGGMSAFLKKKQYRFFSSKNKRVHSVFTPGTFLRGKEQTE